MISRLNREQKRAFCFLVSSIAVEGRESEPFFVQFDSQMSIDCLHLALAQSLRLEARQIDVVEVDLQVNCGTDSENLFQMGIERHLANHQVVLIL